MAGPSYRLHKKLFFFTPSVHALAGVDHDDFTVPNNSDGVFDLQDTDFAAAGGVAFDGNLSRHWRFAWRRWITSTPTTTAPTSLPSATAGELWFAFRNLRSEKARRVLSR